MSNSLTQGQRRVFDAICRLIEEHKIPPTVREIAEFCGIKSPNGVMQHLNQLIALGFIEMRANQARTIHVLKGTNYCPYCGKDSDGSKTKNKDPGTG